MTRILEVFVVIVCAAPFFFLLGRKVIERERHMHQFDGARMGSPTNGSTVEVFDPPFWRIRRLLIKRKCTVEIDFMMDDEMGIPRLKNLRAREVKNPHDVCPLCKRPYRLS